MFVAQAGAAAGPGAGQDDALIVGPRIVAGDVVAPGKRHHMPGLASGVEHGHRMALDMQRQIQANSRQQTTRPRPGGQHDRIGLKYGSIGQGYVCDAVPLPSKALDRRVLHDLRAMSTGGAGNGVGGAERVGVAIFRLPQRQGDMVQRKVGRGEGARRQCLDPRALAADTLGRRLPTRLIVLTADPHHADLGDEGPLAGDLRQRHQNLAAANEELRQFRHQVESMQQRG